jgi:hypothetical protein
MSELFTDMFFLSFVAVPVFIIKPREVFWQMVSDGKSTGLRTERLSILSAAG